MLIAIWKTLSKFVIYEWNIFSLTGKETENIIRRSSSSTRIRNSKNSSKAKQHFLYDLREQRYITVLYRENKSLPLLTIFLRPAQCALNHFSLFIAIHFHCCVSLSSSFCIWMANRKMHGKCFEQFFNFTKDFCVRNNN